jgi:hypothetical protein
MNTQPAHKVASVSGAMRSAASSFSPFRVAFDPIESIFAELKVHFRKPAADDAFRQFCPSECLYFFARAGHDKVDH